LFLWFLLVVAAAAVKRSDMLVLQMCVSGARQDAVPQSSTSAVFTQLAACLHSLHDAIKGEQRHEPLFLCSLLQTGVTQHDDSLTYPPRCCRRSSVGLDFCFHDDTHQPMF